MGTHALRIESLQTGAIRWIAPGTRRAVRSGIAKQQQESIEVAAGGVIGDEIEDLENHGGEGQAVYLYARSDYAFWENELGQELAGGSFGENVTLDAWPDYTIRVGDRLVFDGVELEITGVRVPCSRFAARVTELRQLAETPGGAEVADDLGAGWVKRFTKARRPGFYARVIKPGTLRPGDSGRLTGSSQPTIGALDLWDLYSAAERDPAQVSLALDSPVDARIRQWLESLDD